MVTYAEMLNTLKNSDALTRDHLLQILANPTNAEDIISCLYYLYNSNLLTDKESIHFFISKPDQAANYATILKSLDDAKILSLRHLKKVRSIPDKNLDEISYTIKLLNEQKILDATIL